MPSCRIRWVLVPSYFVLVGLVIWLVGSQLGKEIFPIVDTGQFQLRLRAPDGTRIERTEQIAVQALDFIKEEVGPDNVELSLGYVGLIGSSYPINNIFLWTRGPEEAVLRVALKRGSGIRVEELKHTLARKTTTAFRRVAGRAIADRRLAGRADRPARGCLEVLLRAGRHRQRGNELWLAHAGGSRRQRA